MVQSRPRGYAALRKGRISLPGHYYLITTITHQREPRFLDFSTACLMSREISSPNTTNLATTLAWVLMPDHLHWLIQLDGKCLSTVVARMKGRTARLINRLNQHSGPVWQPGFHDRALRGDEDIVKVARYIIANPLRAGLCQSVGEYPFWNAVWLSENR